MTRKTSCCFTGHRLLEWDFSFESLYGAIVQLITENCVDTFICGGALGFDTLAAEAVLKAKDEGYDVRLHIYAPCNNQSDRWSLAQRAKYNYILDKADYVDMVDRPYFDGCMKIRNYKMVDASDYCICYYKEEKGRFSGTGQTVRYAERSGLKIINIAVNRQQITERF